MRAQSLSCLKSKYQSIFSLRGASRCAGTDISRDRMRALSRTHTTQFHETDMGLYLDHRQRDILLVSKTPYRMHFIGPFTQAKDMYMKTSSQFSLHPDLSPNSPTLEPNPLRPLSNLDSYHRLSLQPQTTTKCLLNSVIPHAAKTEVHR